MGGCWATGTPLQEVEFGSMKRCTVCREEKPEEAFYLDKGKPRANCKECHKAFQKKRREENAEEVSAVRKARYARKKDVILAQQKVGRDRDKDRINAGRRQARAENPEKFQKTQRDYIDANRERVNEVRRKRWERERDRLRAQARAYRRANPDKAREWERTRRERHREKINAYQLEYYRQNPEVFEKGRARRRARLAEVEHEDYTRREIFDRDGGVCRGCGKELIYGPNQFAIDHIVPISLGGPDTRANVQLMCQPCNRAKWANLEGQIHLPV